MAPPKMCDRIGVVLCGLDTGTAGRQGKHDQPGQATAKLVTVRAFRTKHRRHSLAWDSHPRTMTLPFGAFASDYNDCCCVTPSQNHPDTVFTVVSMWRPFG